MRKGEDYKIRRKVETMPYVEMIVKIVSKRSEMDLNENNRKVQYDHFKDQLLKIPSVNYIRIQEFELLD